MRVSNILGGGILGGGDDRGLDDFDDGGFLFDYRAAARQRFGQRYDNFDQANGGLRNQSFTRGGNLDRVRA